MKIIGLSIFTIFILFSGTSYAQSDSVIFSHISANRFYFGIEAGLAISSPLKIINLEGPEKASNTPAPGLEYGIKFGWVWKHRNYLTAGLKVFELNNGINIHSNYDIGDDEGFFSPFLITLSTFNYLSIPFTYEYSIHRGRNSSLNPTGGVTVDMFLNGSSSSSYTITDSLNVANTIFDSYLYGEKLTRITAHLGLAYYFSVFRFQDCRVGLQYNHSFREIMQGEYVVDQNYPDYSYGTLSMSGSYFAVNAGYLFTGTRKMKSRKVKASGYDPLKFPKFDVGVNFNSNFYPKPESTKEAGNLNLVTKSAVSFEGGLSLQCRLSSRFSIHSGIRFGSIPATYGYDYPANFIAGFPEPMSAQYKMGGLNYWKVPFTFEANLFKGKYFDRLGVVAGIDLQRYNLVGGEDFERAVSQNSQDTIFLFFIEMEANPNETFNLNYTAGLSYYFNLFRPSDLRVHVNYNLSTYTAVSGEYTMLEDTPHFTYGKYRMNSNHFSFGMSYYFRRKVKPMNLN